MTSCFLRAFSKSQQIIFDYIIAIKILLLINQGSFNCFLHILIIRKLSHKLT
jgi:hypothetical protein